MEVWGLDCVKNWRSAVKILKFVCTLPTCAYPVVVRQQGGTRTRATSSSSTAGDSLRGSRGGGGCRAGSCGSNRGGSDSTGRWRRRRCGCASSASNGALNGGRYELALRVVRIDIDAGPSGTCGSIIPPDPTTLCPEGLLGKNCW